MTKSAFDKIEKRARKFGDLSNAFSWCNHSLKTMVVVLGCDGLFWAVSFADGALLEKAGYELAKN